MMSDSMKAEIKWWQTGVTYQIYPRSFKDSTGNGIGDLEGIIQKLDYLHELGIDAVWLSPFYPSPMADFGYDVSDYCGVHPLFGDLDTIDRLVEQAHHRSIKVIIDYVPNHTSDQHPWFLESRSSKDNPKRGWYIWRDPRPDGSPPNNWGSLFGGPAWEWDGATEQFYFHHFLKEQPDLNWRNPDVRQAMLDVLRFWLDRGVDGFRMDVVGMILKDQQLRDNPLNPSAPADMPAADIFGRQLNIYNQDLDEVHEIIVEFRRLLDERGDFCAIGEVWSQLPRWVKYYGENGDGLHLPFNFRLINLPWKADLIRSAVDEMEAALPAFAWPNYVLGSHDVPRLASRVGAAQARVAAILLLTLRGTPTLYYGDELGLENGEIPFDKMQDPQGIRLGPARSRDVSRTPMQWDSSENAGFSTGEPWLPVSADYPERSALALSADPRSILHLYQRLLALRRETPALVSGPYHPVDIDTPGCYVYLRQHSAGDYLVALNFTQQARSIHLPWLAGEALLSTHLDVNKAPLVAEVSLRPHEGLVIKIRQDPPGWQEGPSGG
jgi:alpha-glucosidase